MIRKAFMGLQFAPFSELFLNLLVADVFGHWWFSEMNFMHVFLINWLTRDENINFYGLCMSMIVLLAYCLLYLSSLAFVASCSWAGAGLLWSGIWACSSSTICKIFWQYIPHSSANLSESSEDNQELWKANYKYSITSEYKHSKGCSRDFS